MQLEDFRPRPALVTRTTFVERAHFPVIDAHNHLAAPFGGGWDQRPVAELLDQLDQAGVEKYVDLDGGWGEEILNRHLDLFKAAAPERFAIFGGVDWDRWSEHGDRFGEWAAARFREQVARGAEGLKIWKPFGLHVRDQHDKLVAVDDQRLDPLWAAAGELKLPVMIHVADPVAFFQPLDNTNERWEEMSRHPDWQFNKPPFPSFETIIEGLANLVTQHSGTNFIGAHVACYSENLQWVSDLMDRCPNLYVDFSARLGEIGRQPYSARRFFLRHADHIVFGTDAGPSLTAYRTYYRFLETDDEYFSYDGRDASGQGRWRIYGIFLPDDVLEKVYYRNAQRLVFHG